MPQYAQCPAKNTYSTYGIWLYNEKSTIIKTLKEAVNPNMHGYRQWNSAYLLMDYFTFHPLKNKNNILDIGCGWGPVSIYLASRGHKVTALDIDEQVFEFLNLQADLNQVKVKTLQASMDELSKKDLANYETITGADICFWPEMKDSWFALLKRAAHAGVKKAMLADPGRQPFLDLVDKCTEKWKCTIEPWYCLEPKKFTGHLLIIDLTQKS
jgi:predicted nicotinamide N-methyase